MPKSVPKELRMPLEDFTDYAGRTLAHPNPLYDYLTTFVPRQLKSFFMYCDYLYYNSPQVFAALNKFAQYPVTSILYETDSDKLKQKYTTLLENTLLARTVLMRTGIDRQLYGNSFVSIYFPFKRFLVCPQCQSKTNIKFLDFKFKISGKKYKFSFTCPECSKHVEGSVKDEKLRLPSGINIIRWDPKYIEIEKNSVTGESVYYYTIPEELKTLVKKGDRHTLTTLPLGFIETIAQKKIFKFAKNRIYHMRSDAPSGIDNRWGLPTVAATLKQFFYTAILRKANESIGLEYIVPYRVMSPKQNTASMDPTMSISLSTWMEQMKTNIRAWRRDPLHIMFAPIPVEVTQVGGQGRALMVTGEIAEAENNIIASMGITREFLYGGLSATGSGVTLRMLENQLLNYTKELVGELQWISDQCATYLGWKKIKVDLEPFKFVDDVQQKMMIVRLHQESGGQLLSNSTVMRLFGYDLDEERKLRLQETIDEQRFQNDLESKIREMQENLAARARASTATELPQGYDQQEIVAQADGIVQQIAEMPEGTRRSYLHALQTEDYVMYSVVIQRWEAFQTQQQAVMRQQTGVM